MNPAELFPGAVVIHDDIVKEVKMPSFDWVHLIGEELPEHRDFLMPLPLSPAVLAGLGFVRFDDHYMVLNSPTKPEHLFADLTTGPVMFTLTHPRSPDTMALRGFPSTSFFQFVSEYFYGVTLTWNQAAYEKAKGDSNG